MKQTILLLLLSISLSGCSKYEELFEITDKYVLLLDTTYERFGVVEKLDKTIDGEYEITGMGRLIIVKISSYVPESEYEALKKALAKRYKNDDRVNDVFINKKGLVTIDCRNQI